MSQGIYYDGWSSKEPLKYDGWGEASNVYPVPPQAGYSTLYNADFTVEIPSGWNHTNTSSATYWDGNRIQYTGVTLQPGRVLQPYRSYLFDGTNDYIDISGDPLGSSVTDFTLSVWIKPTTTTAWRTIFGAGSQADDLWLGIKDGFLRYYTTADSNIASTAAVLINTVYHIAIVKSGNTVSFYVDGAFIDDIGIGGSTVNITTTTLYIGKDGFGDYYTGGLWDLKYFNSSLQASDIINIYNGNSITESPILHLKCDEGDASSVAYDSSGLDHHGTITNATLATFHNEDSSLTAYGSNYQNMVGYAVGTNYLAYSEDFTNAAWIVETVVTKVGVVAGVGPNGESAMRVSFTGAPSTSRLYQSIVLVATMSLGVFIRAVSGTTSIRLRLGGNISADIPITETWQLIKFENQATTTGTPARGIQNNVAANTGDVYILYAMNNMGATLNPYEKTTTANNVGALLPRDESNTTLDVLGNPLAFTGEISSDPRFEPWGLLLEANATNLMNHAERFDLWANHSAIVAETVAAPSGAISAQRIQPVGAADIVQHHTTISVDNGQYSVSFYVKGTGQIDLTALGVNGVETLGTSNYSFTTNTFTGLGTLTGTSLVRGDWRLLQISGFDNNSTATIFVNRFIIPVGSNVTMWGWSLQKSYASYSYIPTNGTTVSRSTDVLSGEALTTVSTNGAYLLEFSLPLEGAVYGDGEQLCKLYDNHGKVVYIQLGSSNAFTYSGDTSYFTFNKVTLLAFTLYRIVIQTRDNGTNELYLNGALLSSAAYNTTSLTGDISFSYSNYAKAYHLRKLIVYTELSQSDAIALSTVPPALSLQFNNIAATQYIGSVI